MFIKFVFSFLLISTFSVGSSVLASAHEFDEDIEYVGYLSNKDITERLCNAWQPEHVYFLLRGKSIYVLYGMLIEHAYYGNVGVSPETYARQTLKPADLVQQCVMALEWTIDQASFKESFFIGKDRISLNTWNMTACELYALQDVEKTEMREEFHTGVVQAYAHAKKHFTGYKLAHAHLAFRILQMLMMPGFRMV